MISAAQSVRTSHPQLESPSFRQWLDEPFFELGDVSLSRRQITHITETPCTRAARQFQDVCRAYGIGSLDRVYDVGHRSMSRCRGFGERTAWVAAMILYTQGYRIDKWLKSENVVSLRAHIRRVHAQTRKQKHG